MKSVILMFVGGLVGGMLGPAFALTGVTIGFLAGRLMVDAQDTASR